MSEFLHCLNNLLSRQCTTISVLGLVMFNIPLKSTFLQVKVECTLTLGSQNKVPISGQISKCNIPLNSNPSSQSLRRGWVYLGPQYMVKFLNSNCCLLALLPGLTSPSIFVTHKLSILQVTTAGLVAWSKLFAWQLFHCPVGRVGQSICSWSAVSEHCGP